jgi:hypothetical protein
MTLTGPADLHWQSKLQGHHRERLAVVYVRQSTLQQVQDHQESTRLQYGLTSFAQQLGWPADRTLVIDDDLGKSGSTTAGRLGFQRLVTEVTLNHVGLILGLEMSRLARSNTDWHHLLEVCALFRTLIADQDGLYDPAQYNDRLLLGLNRPETQSTSYSTFCETTGLGMILVFGTGARLPPVQAISAADISDMLRGETPAKGAAQTSTIQLGRYLGIGVPRR